MARKFLYVVAFLTFIVILCGVIWALFSDRLIRMALVPGVPFTQQGPMATNAYADRAMWYAHPDAGLGNPAEWLPKGVAATAPATRGASVFFIHPTSYLTRAAWNAPLDDQASADLARTFIKGQASSFNGVGAIWAPRYRQATFGSFLTTQADAQKALDAAYGDVAMAFDAFIAQAPEDRPIVLAGHSQGALHLMRLLRERVANKPLAARIVAAYVVGWPVSVDTDVKAMGLPVCATPDQAGCILSWQSFAEPADTKLITDVYDATTGFDGRPRKGTAMLCTNPLTGTPNGSADAKANLGTVVPSADLKDGTLVVGGIPAKCDARGFLLIGPPPKGIDSYVLPGNNYHVFDYSLFWSNIRADAARRLAAFGAKP
jgi:Protein of unknown function (DUF3089)